MVPGPRKAPAGGYYPSIHASQDVSFDLPHRKPLRTVPEGYAPSSAQFRENLGKLSVLGNILKNENYARPPGMKKLTRKQLATVMNKQIKAFVNVFRRMYEWRDWIWWGSMKYLQLARNSI